MEDLELEGVVEQGVFEHQQPLQLLRTQVIQLPLDQEERERQINPVLMALMDLILLEFL